ncbi:MAG: hypothetical protein GY811_17940 [Myxococcales bacterium]|nr:hypothetical protein [Myxococcales bacterium]
MGRKRNGRDDVSRLETVRRWRWPSAATRTMALSPTFPHRRLPTSKTRLTDKGRL